jgi:hypothetical protein
MVLTGVELGVRNLDHELADLGVEGVEWKIRMCTKSSLKATCIMLAAGTKGNEAPMKLSSRGQGFGGRCSTKTSIGNVENLNDVVT